MSPTARSLALLRSLGFASDVTERFIAAINRRRDFLRIGDLIGVHERHGFLMIQATSLPNVAARVNKAKGIAALATWLKAGGMFEVHGWHKRGEHWEVRRVTLRTDDMVPVEVTPRRRLQKQLKAGSLFD